MSEVVNKNMGSGSADSLLHAMLIVMHHNRCLYVVLKCTVLLMTKGVVQKGEESFRGSRCRLYD